MLTRLALWLFLVLFASMESMVEEGYDPVYAFFGCVGFLGVARFFDRLWQRHFSHPDDNEPGTERPDPGAEVLAPFLTFLSISAGVAYWLFARQDHDTQQAQFEALGRWLAPFL